MTSRSVARRTRDRATKLLGPRIVTPLRSCIIRLALEGQTASYTFTRPRSSARCYLRKAAFATTPQKGRETRPDRDSLQRVRDAAELIQSLDCPNNAGFHRPHVRCNTTLFATSGPSDANHARPARTSEFTSLSFRSRPAWPTRDAKSPEHRQPILGEPHEVREANAVAGDDRPLR